MAQRGTRLAPGSSSHRVAAVSTVGPRGARGPPLWGVATLVCPALLSMDIRLPLFQEALNTAAADIRTCLCVGMFSFHVGNTQGGIAGSWGLGTVSLAVPTAMRSQTPTSCA